MTVLQGVRASVRPEEAQRKVKEWQDNFKAYQTALQRLSAAPFVPAPSSSALANSGSIYAESHADVPLATTSQVLQSSSGANHSST
jgi:hypothetical protein